MERYTEAMKQSIELSETILEGFMHIHRLIDEGQFEQATMLFGDALSGIASIQSAVKPVLESLENIETDDVIISVVKAAGTVVNLFEEKNYMKVQEVLQFTLVPQFNRLNEELRKLFTPFLVS